MARKPSVKTETAAAAINVSHPAPAIVTPFQAVVNASYDAAASGETLRLAFIAAGGNQAEPRKALLIGRIMHSLKCTQEDALIVLGKKGNPDKKTSVPDGTRTVEEEKAYGAARGYLTARLKEWGLQTTEGRGGDRTSKDDDGNLMNVDKLVIPGKPKIETAVDLATFALAFAKANYDLFLLNREHPAVKDEIGSELMGAAADYLATVEEIFKRKPS